MSILSQISQVADACGISLETGAYSDTAPDEYIVITPLDDSFELHADNLPEYETQQARISLFSKQNYLQRKNELSKALLSADFVITDRRYIGHENDTGYHYYAIDVAKTYELYELED